MGYNSILDRLVEKYPNAEGINDARNIAEAVACINGVGGRGAGAIADQIAIQVTLTYDVNGGTGSIDPVTVPKGTAVMLNNGSGLTSPSLDKVFNGWAITSTADTASVSLAEPYIVSEDVTLYAVWSSEV